jgi:hypothetical protein
MHPVEHLLYFSVVLIHFVVPSHPIHFFFNAQHTALTPSGGHHGFEGPILDGKVKSSGGVLTSAISWAYSRCGGGGARVLLLQKARSTSAPSLLVCETSSSQSVLSWLLTFFLPLHGMTSLSNARCQPVHTFITYTIDTSNATTVRPRSR